MKTCSRCKVHKELSAFYADPRLRFGVGGWCKDCKNDSQRTHAREIASRPKPVLQEKRCSTCKATKPASEFSRCPSKLDGLASRCKTCRKTAEDRQRMTPERITIARLKWGYGMTPADLNAIIESQGGNCGICREPLRRTYIDHNHTTRRVRGVLCCRCNTWLAAVEHHSYLENALRYLANHKDDSTAKAFYKHAGHFAKLQAQCREGSRVRRA